MMGLLTATVESPKITAQLGATQSSDSTVDTTLVSLHRLLTVMWTQHTGTTEIGDLGVDNNHGHYNMMSFQKVL